MDENSQRANENGTCDSGEATGGPDVQDLAEELDFVTMEPQDQGDQEDKDGPAEKHLSAKEREVARPGTNGQADDSNVNLHPNNKVRVVFTLT